MALENYVPVPVRIAKFKQEHNGEGSITTESFINYEKECASFKAVIRVGDTTLATGHSLVTDLSDDKAFEKGETAAIGRALAHAGYEAESLEEESTPAKKSSKGKKSGLGGLGSKKKAAPKKEEEPEEEETEEEEAEEEAPKKKAKGLPSVGKSSKKKAKAAEEEESEAEEEDESEEDESEEEEAPKKKAKGSSSKLDNVMAKYGLK